MSRNDQTFRVLLFRSGWTRSREVHVLAFDFQWALRRAESWAGRELKHRPRNPARAILVERIETGQRETSRG
jgi:hypothetical protein